MEITDFTDLWIIHFDLNSYSQYKKLVKMGLKDRVKEYLLSRYLTNCEIEYSLTGKPFVSPGGSCPTIYFSFSSNTKAAALAVSNSDIGVDLEDRERDLRKLVTWAQPFMDEKRLWENSKDERYSILLSQLIWCRIESFIKLSNSTLFDFLSNRKQSNQLSSYQKIQYETLVCKDFVCVVAKQESFFINQILHINFSDLIVSLQDGT